MFRTDFIYCIFSLLQRLDSDQGDDAELRPGGCRQPGARRGGGGHLQAQGQEGRPQEEEHLRGQGSQVHTKVLQTPHLLLSLQRFYLVSIIQYPFNNKIDIAMTSFDIYLNCDNFG